MEGHRGFIFFSLNLIRLYWLDYLGLARTRKLTNFLVNRHVTGKSLLQAANAYCSRDIYLQHSQNHTYVRLAGGLCKVQTRTADGQERTKKGNN